jgi:hypothetical protein
MTLMLWLPLLPQLLLMLLMLMRLRHLPFALLRCMQRGRREDWRSLLARRPQAEQPAS